MKSNRIFIHFVYVKYNTEGSCAVGTSFRFTVAHWNNYSASVLRKISLVHWKSISFVTTERFNSRLMCSQTLIPCCYVKSLFVHCCHGYVHDFQYHLNCAADNISFRRNKNSHVFYHKHNNLMYTLAITKSNQFRWWNRKEKWYTLHAVEIIKNTLNVV